MTVAVIRAPWRAKKLEALQAVQESEAAVARANRLSGQARQITTALADIRARNGFAESARAALGGRR